MEDHRAPGSSPGGNRSVHNENEDSSFLDMQDFQDKTKIPVENHERMMGVRPSLGFERKLNPKRGEDNVEEEDGTSKNSRTKKSTMFVNTGLDQKREAVRLETEPKAPEINFNADGGFAMPFIMINEKTGELEINEDAINEMNQFDKKICTVCIVGHQGTGKSFLLNKLLDARQNQFKVGMLGMPRVTRGIWMWSKPVFDERNDSMIFFFEAEGFGGHQLSREYDAKIFCLAILLSSLLIYNSVGQLDEESINSFGILKDIFKYIESSSNDANLFSIRAPKLCWLIRDIHLDAMRLRNLSLANQQYLENILTDNHLLLRADKVTLETRQRIINFFGERVLFALPRPTDDETALKNPNLNTNDLTFDFLKEMNNLRDLVLLKITPKEYNGNTITPMVFCKVMDLFVATLNASRTIDMPSTWNTILEDVCMVACEDCASHHSGALQELLQTDEIPRDRKEILDFLRNQRDVTLEEYTSYVSFQVTCNHDYHQIYLKKLQEELDKNEKAFRAELKTIASQKNRAVAQNIFKKFGAESITSLYNQNNLEQFVEDFHTSLTLYCNNSVETEQFDELLEYMNVEFPKMFEILINRVKKIQNDKTQMIQKERETMHKKEKFLNEQIKLLEKSSTDAESKLKAVNDDIEKLKQLKSQMAKQIEERSKFIHDRKSDIEKLKMEIEQQTNEANSLDAKYKASSEELNRLQEQLERRKKKCFQTLVDRFHHFLEKDILFSFKVEPPKMQSFV
eukprot:TRINITY_DN8531_c0_g1_i2.p1 TRINITY_DN8531_c0_g1~~TRINITY_DN8531_c0_g1_i2.p1  ORF type:complete len:741 (-),score=158.84 TRINITY_DN8531_c0_g1_i2:133-2355(-)